MSINGKGISAAGLQQIKQVYTPRYNVIDVSAVEFHSAVGDRKHEKIRSPRASENTPTQGRPNSGTSISHENGVPVPAWLSPRPHTVKEVDNDVVTGYLIGKQIDEETKLKQKKDAQREYYQKVLADTEASKKIQAADSQSNTTTRRAPQSTRPNSPTKQYGGRSDAVMCEALNFGGREDIIQQKSRATQREVMEYNIKYAEESRHLSRNPSMQAKINNPHEHLEIAKMNSSATFCIGKNETAEDARLKVVRDRRLYHEQLLADDEIRKKYDDETRISQSSLDESDHGRINRSQGLSYPTVPYTAAGEYINASGWAGLNVGGAANGQTASVTNLHHKVAKQERYRTALDAQRKESIFIQQSNAEKIEKEFAAAGTKMPYGNI